MCIGTLKGVPIFSLFQAPITAPFECIQSTPQLWFSLMHLISPVYWNEGKRQREGAFACLWRIKEEHPLTWEVKISGILSILMESNDCSAVDFFSFFFFFWWISWQRWINEMWVTSESDPWFHFLPQNCMIHAHATYFCLSAALKWSAEVCDDF